MQKNNIYYLFTLLMLLVSCASDDGNAPLDSTDTEDPIVFLGEINWITTLGGTQEDTAQDITLTADGGTAIVGYTESINGDITDNASEQNNYWVARLDADGNLLWSKTYGGTADDRGEAIKATADGGFIITGYSRSADEDVSQNNGFYDQWIVKLDAAGNIQWEKSIGYSGSDQAFDIIQTSDGGYFTTGFLDITASGGQGNFGRNGTSNQEEINFEHGVGEFWCHKLDANGNITWSRYFGGSNNDRSYAALETDDGNFIIAGSSESDDFDITNSKGSYDFWVVKLSNTGDLIWQESYGGSGIDIGYDIAKTNDGNYIVVGDTRSSDGDVSNLKGAADFWVLKISDTDGSLLWERTYGGTDFDSARGITALQEGGFAIVGSSKSDTVDVNSNYGQNDFWVVKISDSGTITWEKNFGGSQLDIAFGIVETMDKKLIVAGSTQSNDGDIVENKGIKDAFIINIK
ncbi:hypothetical protein C8N46_101619 [Kordia periserrulae]|uniref:Bulb-type lectin domain-containing protein n=1 Tax=Kordia periserrulae TaxID=701523 RepID=A0A2T6C6R2_9FLAO|nr:hypothetical protein [Kordia periserrulae]PTX64009.1 hypothetical protein C8N46_101619 [Kordia periserrulae]